MKDFDRIHLRPATENDIPYLEAWDKEPHVIAATTDDPDATKAFSEDLDWIEELAQQDEHSTFYIAEIDGTPFGAMQIIDPHMERTHYWGEIEPNLRATDIWIGSKEHLGKGYGEVMMIQSMEICFANPEVEAMVIDPLHSNTRAHKFYQRIGFVPTERKLFHEEDDCLVHRLERSVWEKRYKGQSSD